MDTPQKNYRHPGVFDISETNCSMTHFCLTDMDIAGFWIYLYIASGGLMLFHLLVCCHRAWLRFQAGDRLMSTT
jgi:hypothetical protein